MKLDNMTVKDPAVNAPDSVYQRIVFMKVSDFMLHTRLQFEGKPYCQHSFHCVHHLQHEVLQ